MSDTSHNDIFREVLRGAASQHDEAEGPHFVDDDVLLDRWSLGGLGDAERDKLLDHMADCNYCRQELRAMIRADVISIPGVAAVPPAAAAAGAANPETVRDFPVEAESEEVREDIPPEPRQRKGVNLQRIVTVGSGVLAASLLLIMAITSIPEWRASRLIASAEQAMQEGDPALAYQQMTAYYEKGMETRARADQLAISSGSQLARMRLRDGRFGEVLDIEHNLSRRAGPSAELLRLRLQAEQGETNEFTLMRAGSLTGYGYDLRGGDYGKSLPEINDTTDRIVAEFRIATGKYERDVALRLNYGQFLLNLDRWEDAQKQFTIAHDLDKSNSLALLGLGMVEFRQGNFDHALELFKEITRVDPKNSAGHVNAAVCLERLDRPDEAKPYWEQALDLLDEDDPLKTKINDQIFDKKGNVTEA